MKIHVLFATLLMVLFLAASFSIGYELAMEKCLTADCVFEEDSFFLLVDGHIYEWTRTPS